MTRGVADGCCLCRGGADGDGNGSDAGNHYLRHHRGVGPGAELYKRKRKEVNIQ